MKKVMMLGAGNCQLNAIKKINELGYISLASDNRMDSVGKKIADIKILADTFSYEETYNESLINNIDAIMTSGTDQPVLIVNQIAEKLNLPHFISSVTSKNVTNKKYMKKLFTENNIPTTSYVLCKRDFHDKELSLLKPPYVVKPVDSQGQRGIYKLNTIEEIRIHFDDVLLHSREDEILIEEYYENKEITVSGWIDEGNCKVLTVTDRVTFNSDSHIGVCVSHEYPSIHLNEYSCEIFNITEDICEAFNIEEGPIYFQYLVGKRGVLVNEIACRIGGAYEDTTIPMITGVDILSMNIEGSISSNYDKSSLKDYIYNDKGTCSSTQLFFCNPGKISYLTPKEELLKHEFVMDMGYNFKLHETIPGIENASQRAGYIIITGKDEQDIKANIKTVFDELKILDDEANNLVMRGKRWYRE